MSRASWSALAALVIFTMGTSIITPLLPLYQERFSLSNGEATLLFATYTATVVPTMLVMGNLSDRIGRRRVMFPAMASITAASLVLGFAESVPLLFLGRVLQGLAIGGFLGVGTALVVDHAAPAARERAAAIAGLGFRLGFGLGPGLAGIIAQRSSNPIHAPFQWHAGLMVVAILALVLTPETIARRRAARLRIRVGVPAGQLMAFWTFLAPSAFLLSFLDATLLSVVPLYMVQTLEVESLVVIGLVGFLILGTGGLAPILFARTPPRAAVMSGVATASSASFLVAAAAALSAPALVVVAAGVIGLLNGLILQGATVICGISVPLSERGKLISTLYMCAYAGTTPTVGLGYLSGAIGLTPALVVFSTVAVALAAFVLLVGARAFREVLPYREVPRGALG